MHTDGHGASSAQYVPCQTETSIAETSKERETEKAVSEWQRWEEKKKQVGNNDALLLCVHLS